MKLTSIYLLEHLCGLEHAYTRKWDKVKASRLVAKREDVKKHTLQMKKSSQFFLSFKDRIRIKKLKVLEDKNNYYALGEVLEVYDE